MIRAVLWGLAIGAYFSRKHSPMILLFVTLRKFHTEEDFEALYDLCDDDFAYEMARGEGNDPPTYHKFLILHQNGRSIAGELITTANSLKQAQLLRYYAIIFLIALPLFWSSILYFALAFSAAHIAHMTYLYYYKRQRAGFYAIVIHNMVIKSEEVKALTN